MQYQRSKDRSESFNRCIRYFLIFLIWKLTINVRVYYLEPFSFSCRLWEEEDLFILNFKYYSITIILNLIQHSLSTFQKQNAIKLRSEAVTSTCGITSSFQTWSHSFKNCSSDETTQVSLLFEIPYIIPIFCFPYVPLVSYTFNFITARLSALAAIASSQPIKESAVRYIKVCGVTNVEDAILAASSGANLIGMILWPKAKRSITPATARAIAAAARQHGASPVGVFVDEDAATILRVCEESEIDIAQLHGDGARNALPDLPSLRTVYVMHADKTGTVQTVLPPADLLVDWVLLDSLQGGSGERFDWSSLAPPKGRCGWLLAGGLTPDNVAEAIGTAGPTGVDVSSGVCGPDGLKKDEFKVQQYVAEARRAMGL